MPESSTRWPSSPELQLQQALQLVKAGQRTQALDVLRRLLSATPEMILPRQVLAMLLHESGDPKAALVEVDEAVTAAPTDATTQEVRATILIELGRHAEAALAARAALAINADRPRAWQSLGLALDAQGSAQEAIAAMQSALALQPNSAVARQVLVRRLLQQRRADAALQAALHESLFDDEARAHAAAGDFLALGAQAQAIEFMQGLAGHDPQNYASLMQLARTLHRLGRSSEALV